MSDNERTARAMWAAVCNLRGPDGHDYDNEADWQRLCTEDERDVFRLAAEQVWVALGRMQSARREDGR